MTVTILYFASLRESLSRSQESLELPPACDTLGALRQHLAARGGVWEALLAPRIQMARNQVLVRESAVLSADDEIAFFPPVTGG